MANNAATGPRAPASAKRMRRGEQRRNGRAGLRIGEANAPYGTRTRPTGLKVRGSTR
jgi:hypothetical protein